MPALKNPKQERVAQELAIGKSAEEASAALDADGRPIYDTSASSFASNARRRAQHPAIRARVAELRAPAIVAAEESVAVTVEWMLAKLKSLAEYNIDDYLTPPDDRGRRYVDLSYRPSRSHLMRLTHCCEELWQS
jgi:hypothetical protein